MWFTVAGNRLALFWLLCIRYQ